MEDLVGIEEALPEGLGKPVVSCREGSGAEGGFNGGKGGRVGGVTYQRPGGEGGGKGGFIGMQVPVEMASTTHVNIIWDRVGHGS